MCTMEILRLILCTVYVHYGISRLILCTVYVHYGNLKLSLSCRCQNLCATRVCLRERKRIFDDFYKLTNHDSQNKYLYGLIERSVPKQRRRRRSATEKARRNTFYYYVRLTSGDLVKVCKQAFCEIHGVGKRRVEILCEKLVSGVLFSGDNRGKHNNRPHATSDDLKAQIREHMSSQESHYSRHDNNNCLTT
jgi:hypothetical protein